MTSYCTPATIEYIRGPFDGHRECVPNRDQALPEDLLCIVNENVFRLIDGIAPVPHVTHTSIAVYERKARDGGWIYLFVESLPIETIVRACVRVGLSLGAGDAHELP